MINIRLYSVRNVDLNMFSYEISLPKLKKNNVPQSQVLHAYRQLLKIAYLLEALCYKSEDRGFEYR
jgi:hypothetical protein